MRTDEKLVNKPRPETAKLRVTHAAILAVKLVQYFKLLILVTPRRETPGKSREWGRGKSIGEWTVNDLYTWFTTSFEHKRPPRKRVAAHRTAFLTWNKTHTMLMTKRGRSQQ
jgi:hypothetical protein